MKRKLLTIALGTLVACGMGSCKEDPDRVYEDRPYCEIETFSVPVSNIEVSVDRSTGTVTLYVAAYLMNEVSAQLKDVKPNAQISPEATVSPSFAENQDFSEDVTYVVTAEDGTKKTWTVKLTPVNFQNKGISKVTTRYVRAAAAAVADTDIKVDASTNTVAVYGDTVVITRFQNKLIDGNTGTIIPGKFLNVEGIECSSNAANNIPFIMGNDSKGNLVGATLGQFVTIGKWKVYKWASPSAKPVEVINFEGSTKFGTGNTYLGRKMGIVGDINGDALFTSVDVPASVDATQTSPVLSWKITNGVAAAPVRHPAPVSGGKTIMDRELMIWPTNTGGITPNYFSARVISAPDDYNPRLGYTSADNTVSFIAGKATDTSNGFGTNIYHTQPFDFNGSKYIAAVASFQVEPGKCNVYTQIIEVSGNSGNVVFIGKEEFPITMSAVNANGNSGVAVSVVKEGTGDDEGLLTCRIYSMFSGTAFIAYDVTNSLKEPL